MSVFKYNPTDDVVLRRHVFELSITGEVRTFDNPDSPGEGAKAARHIMAAIMGEGGPGDDMRVSNVWVGISRDGDQSCHFDQVSFEYAKRSETGRTSHELTAVRFSKGSAMNIWALLAVHGSNLNYAEYAQGATVNGLKRRATRAAEDLLCLLKKAEELPDSN